MGLFNRTPVDIKTCKIDRIGMAHAHSYNLEVWYAVFEGENIIRHIRASKISNNSHLVLAKPGDEVLVSFKGDSIVGFKNLTLLG